MKSNAIDFWRRPLPERFSDRGKELTKSELYTMCDEKIEKARRIEAQHPEIAEKIEELATPENPMYGSTNNFMLVFRSERAKDLSEGEFKGPMHHYAIHPFYLQERLNGAW